MSTDFGGRVLAWYERHGRKDLPWQQDRDAYRIWVSEIMLQQTQVQTVIPYFRRFIASFPDVVALANADVDDVLNHWSGLGYYARARNLYRAAVVIRDEHGGVFPDAFDTVAALSGIGRSTAGAILSLAFGQRHPILDGNVKRVLARHAAIDGWPGTTTVAKQLWALADERTPMQRAGDYTQAIMDLGAIICTRTKPACSSCPVGQDCVALASGDVDRYPGRKPAKAKPLRETTMLLAVMEDAVYLERRPASGIWGGLWSLPEADDVDAWCADKLDTPAIETEAWDTLRHSFSHYDLDIRPVVVRVAASSSKVADDADVTWHRLDDSPPGGIAAPVTRLIETLRNTSGSTNYG
jgi:A/G-specific adenine glycosylase